MRKVLRLVSLVIAAVLFLTGCAGTNASQNADTDKTAEEAETVSEVPAASGQEEAGRVYAAGPYGTLSVVLPEGWDAEAYASGSEKSNSGSYGMWIRPAGEETGYIDVCYMITFGVCGTGLKQETSVIAGEEASIGTYDDHKMWDFVSFHGAMEGVTAQNVMAEGWPEQCREQTMTILDTLRFDPDRAEGAVSYFRRDSEIPEIGLIAEACDITSTGATVRFQVWDPDLAGGELQYGDDFTLERQDGEDWTELPVIVEGDWGFNEIAYTIPKEPDASGSEWQVNWEWLYGKLEPGDYRIGKTIHDFRGPGNYTQYRIYVYFRYAQPLQTSG